jgi:hypothetical protein
MAAQADAYRARAAGHDRKAETLGGGNAAIRAYYQRLAKHWRSLALLIEVKTEREHPTQRRLPAESTVRHTANGEKSDR